VGVAFYETYDVCSSKLREARASLGAVLTEKIPQRREMSNNRHPRKSALLQQVTPEVLLDLHERSWDNRWLRCDHTSLAKHRQKPIKCGAIAEKRLPIPHPELLVLLYGRLIHVINTKVLSGEPTTEITHDANATRPTLITMSFSEQSCGINIDMDAQRAFTQSTRDLRILKVRGCSHVLSSSSSVGREIRLCRVNCLQDQLVARDGDVGSA
jgi:hypothetical protein